MSISNRARSWLTSFENASFCWIARFSEVDSVPFTVGLLQKCTYVLSDSVDAVFAVNATESDAEHWASSLCTRCMITTAVIHYAVNEQPLWSVTAERVNSSIRRRVSDHEPPSKQTFKYQDHWRWRLQIDRKSKSHCTVSQSSSSRFDRSSDSLRVHSHFAPFTFATTLQCRRLPQSLSLSLSLSLHPIAAIDHLISPKSPPSAVSERAGSVQSAPQSRGRRV